MKLRILGEKNAQICLILLTGTASAKIKLLVWSGQPFFLSLFLLKSPNSIFISTLFTGA